MACHGAEPDHESQVPRSQSVYVPRDEQFGHLKADDFRDNTITALVGMIMPIILTLVSTTPKANSTPSPTS